MCGRYVSPDQAAIEREWHVGRSDGNPFRQRFNVAPTATVPILRLNPESGALELMVATWGLIPVWWKEPKPPRLTFNARSEEAATKPMWRQPLQSARCLVPAEGWYEWQMIERADPETGEVTKAKQPQFIRRQDGKLFCFAGVMSQRRGAEGEPPTLSCSILTAAAAPSVAAVHIRMPVVLQDTAHGAWLDRKLKDSTQAIALALDHADTDFEHYPVSARVSNARNEGPELLKPIELAH